MVTSKAFNGTMSSSVKGCLSYSVVQKGTKLVFFQRIKCERLRAFVALIMARTFHVYLFLIWPCLWITFLKSTPHFEPEKGHCLLHLHKLKVPRNLSRNFSKTPFEGAFKISQRHLDNCWSRYSR